MRIQILILGFKGLNHTYKPVRIHSLLAANDLEWFENQPLRILTVPINKYHQLKWYKSLWVWRWLPHRLSKRQSLSTTTVLFGTMFTRTIVLNFNTYEMTPGFNPVTKESELNRPWTSDFSFYFRISFDLNMTVSAKFRLACVATVSNRVMARKLERERKKTRWKWERKGRRGRFSKSWSLRASVSWYPLPVPRHSFISLLSSQLFSANSRGNACYAG